MLGVGLFVALLVRERRFASGAALLLVGLALLLKGGAAMLLLKPAVFVSWLSPGVLLGVAAGALLLLPATLLPRPAQVAVCAVALLSSLLVPLLAPDLMFASPPLTLFNWRYGHLLNFNGLTRIVLVAWPLAGGGVAVRARRTARLGRCGRASRSRCTNPIRYNSAPFAARTMSYYKHHVFFCLNQRDPPEKCCSNVGAADMQAYAKSRIKALGLSGKGSIRINKSGCLDRCEEGPVLVVYPDEVWYTYVDRSDIDEIIDRHLVHGEIVERLRI